MLKNKLIYIPAISAGATFGCLEKNLPLEEYSSRFYNKKYNIFFYYPYLMVSAGHKKNKTNIRKEIDFPRSSDHVFFGDSGGYQFAKGVLDISKIHELRKEIFLWIEKNCDKSLTLDVPPYVTGNKTVFGFSNFEKRAQITRENNIYFQENMTGKVDYINILHGRSYNEHKKWYELCIKDFNFQGLSIGSWSNFKHILLGIAYLLKKKELQKDYHKNLHILGVTRIEWLIYLNYIQFLFNKMDIDIQITTDSSTPIKGAAFGHYILFINLNGYQTMSMTNKKVSKKEDIIEYENLFGETKQKIKKEVVQPFDWSDKKNYNLPCFCPVCRKIKIKHLTKFDTQSYTYNSLHNLWKVIEFQNMIQNLIVLDKENSYPSFLRKKLNLIKEYFESKKPYEKIEISYPDTSKPLVPTLLDFQ